MYFSVHTINIYKRKEEKKHQFQYYNLRMYKYTIYYVNEGIYVYI